MTNLGLDAVPLPVEQPFLASRKRARVPAQAEQHFQSASGGFRGHTRPRPLIDSDNGHADPQKPTEAAAFRSTPWRARPVGNGRRTGWWGRTSEPSVRAGVSTSQAGPRSTLPNPRPPHRRRPSAGVPPLAIHRRPHAPGFTLKAQGGAVSAPALQASYEMSPPPPDRDRHLGQRGVK